MFLSAAFPVRFPTSFPRARGDVPAAIIGLLVGPPFSPRTRGCSSVPGGVYIRHRVFPAHAGMFPRFPSWCQSCYRFPRARGDVPPMRRKPRLRRRFSPRTRGCSSGRIKKSPSSRVFPAHAGMFPVACERDTPLSGFPRARGDVPIL